MNSFICESPASQRSDRVARLLALIVGHEDLTQKTLRLASKLSPESSVEEIRREGFTEKQAVSIHAALGLGHELFTTIFQVGERFTNSRGVFERYRGRCKVLATEHFIALSLNSKNQLIREVLVSVGSLSMSVVHPRDCFVPLVHDRAAAAVFLHNHPSGDPAPSREDRECTLRLVQAGQLLGIRVLDHIVIGFEDYYSFADAGCLAVVE